MPFMDSLFVFDKPRWLTTL